MKWLTNNTSMETDEPLTPETFYAAVKAIENEPPYDPRRDPVLCTSLFDVFVAELLTSPQRPLLMSPRVRDQLLVLTPEEAAEWRQRASDALDRVLGGKR